MIFIDGTLPLVTTMDLVSVLPNNQLSAKDRCTQNFLRIAFQARYS